MSLHPVSPEAARRAAQPPPYYHADARRGPQQPLVTMRPAILLQLLLAMIVASLLFLCANYGINALLFGVDKEPVRQHLRQAFASGELDLLDSRRGDRDLGVHQLNDCLIYDMAARDAAPDQFSRYLFLAQRTEPVGRPDTGMCLRLRNWLFDDPLVESDSKWRERYLYGFRAVAIGLLKVFTVPQARGIMKAASYGVFLALAAISLAALLARMARPGGRASGLLRGGNELGYLAVALGFLGFFGLPFFGQSISHAPSIVSLGVFLLAWCVLDLRRALTARRMLGLCIALGLLTAHFEFLTGYIPVGSSLLVLLLGLSQTQEDRLSPADLARLLFLTQAAFIGSIILVYSFHLLAAALLTPDGSRLLQSFFVYLGVRMSTQVQTGDDARQLVEVGPGDVFAAFFKQLASIGLPSDAFGLAALLVALGLLLFGAAEALTSSRPARWKARIFLTAFAIVPVLVWLLAFQNHAVIHARFMVRVLVTLFVAAGVMLWWLSRLRALAQSSPQQQHGPAAEPPTPGRWRELPA